MICLSKTIWGWRQKWPIWICENKLQ